MKKLISLFKTADEIIALVIVIGCIVLMLCRIDGEVKSILALAAGWVFGGAYKESRR